MRIFSQRKILVAAILVAMSQPVVLAQYAVTDGVNAEVKSVDLESLRGEYVLESGKVLYIQVKQHKLVAQLGGERYALTMLSPTSFVNTNRSIQFDFRKFENGITPWVTITSESNMK